MPKNLESQKTNRKWAFLRSRARKEGHEEGSGNGNDYRQRNRANKIARGSKKSGCLPKLFTLILPLIAVGAYLILGL
jgi:hypothetical protein